MSQIKTEAYIFKTVNFNETSRIIQIFSRENGIIPVIIKGAMKGNRAAENFDLFSKSSFVLYEPHSGEMYTYKESNLLDSGIDFSKNIKTYYRVSLIFKIIEKSLPKGSPVTEIYELLDRVISKIRKFKGEEFNKLYVFYFLIKLLEIEGYGLNYGYCSQCKVQFATKAYYSISNSSLLCEKCKTLANYIPLNRDILRIIELMTRGELGKLDISLFMKNENVIFKILSLSFGKNLNVNLEDFREFL